MECLSADSTVLTIINNTKHTMRDIELTYDGLDGNIEILKIKKDYEKTIFFKVKKEAGLVDLKMKFAGNTYLIYKNFDSESEIKIKLEVFEENDGEYIVKPYFFIE